MEQQVNPGKKGKQFFQYLVIITLSHGVYAQAPQIAGCQVFPDNNIWNIPVDTLPTDPKTSAYINTIGREVSIHPDFGSEWEGIPIGIPYNIVTGLQPKVAVNFEYADESDAGPYPIPPVSEVKIEGSATSEDDRHILIVDRDHCKLYELFAAYPQPDQSWQAGSGAMFTLNSHTLRPDSWTSADAAGLPIFPGLVRYEEIAAGEIKHALRFTAPKTRGEYVWPARHKASNLTGSEYPPMGQRFRLRADFDVSSFSPQVQVLLKALKKYGMMLADNGSPWFISGAPDERWDNETLVSELRRVKGSDFEAVEVSSCMKDPNSGEVKEECIKTKSPEACFPSHDPCQGVPPNQCLYAPPLEPEAGEIAIDYYRDDTTGDVWKDQAAWQLPLPINGTLPSGMWKYGLRSIYLAKYACWDQTVRDWMPNNIAMGIYYCTNPKDRQQTIDFLRAVINKLEADQAQGQ